MKVYLDDEREAPERWVRTKTAAETIKLLEEGDVIAVSLDHDLALDHYGNPTHCGNGCGCEVLKWIEEQLALHDFDVPVIELHTMNPSAKQKMELAVKNIRRLYNEQEKRKWEGSN